MSGWCERAVIRRSTAVERVVAMAIARSAARSAGSSSSSASCHSFSGPAVAAGGGDLSSTRTRWRLRGRRGPGQVLFAVGGELHVRDGADRTVQNPFNDAVGVG